MKQSLLLFGLFFFGSDMIAQNHADCTTALEICNKQPLILPMFGPGNDSSEFDNAPCFLGFPNLESSSTWIRWQVAQSGTLWFIIYPLNAADDIDFILCRLPTGNCAEKSFVRCMAAGDNGLNSPCMGPTGLLPGALGISAPPGCAPGLNNFLAPLNVLAGEQYVLAINNFSTSQDTVRVEFCGTALLGCETEMCAVLDANEPESAPDLSIGPITPNPILARETPSILINSRRSQTVLIRVSDIQGHELKRDRQELSLGNNSISLQTHEFQAGVYFVTLISEKTMITRRLVITR